MNAFREAVDASALSFKEQLHLVAELRVYLDDPADRDVAMELLRRLRGRPDIAESVGREVDQLLNLPVAPSSGGPSTERKATGSGGLPRLKRDGPTASTSPGPPRHHDSTSHAESIDKQHRRTAPAGEGNPPDFGGTGAADGRRCLGGCPGPRRADHLLRCSPGRLRAFARDDPTPEATSRPYLSPPWRLRLGRIVDGLVPRGGRSLPYQPVESGHLSESMPAAEWTGTSPSSRFRVESPTVLPPFAETRCD